MRPWPAGRQALRSGRTVRWRHFLARAGASGRARVMGQRRSTVMGPEISTSSASGSLLPPSRSFVHSRAASFPRVLAPWILARSSGSGMGTTLYTPNTKTCGVARHRE